ncbi:MAG: phage head closure protein [Devosia sp.]
MLTGNFRHTIIVQQPTETIGAGGKVMLAWTDKHPLRAELVSNEMAEATADNGDRETRTLIFRTHYRPGITTADRVSHGGKPFNIIKIAEIARGLELHCEAVS